MRAAQDSFGCIIIGADTAVVSPGGEILGKPADRGDARRMLRLLSGAWHEVYTGLALIGLAGGRRPCSLGADRVAPDCAGADYAASDCAVQDCAASDCAVPIRVLTDFAVTRVKMAELCDALIERYIGTGEPFGKAGSYAIQGMGALLVERIDGCYFNVVGLPLGKLSAMLGSMGVEPLRLAARHS
ncbi:MAG: Maf family protein [Clostridiales bacterium]|nr:Maf family protein [Clostridiales bacterium]